MGSRRMFMRLYGMLVGFRVIALLMMLGGRVMGLRGVLVMLSSFLVCFFRHGKKPPLEVYDYFHSIAIEFGRTSVRKPVTEPFTMGL